MKRFFVSCGGALLVAWVSFATTWAAPAEVAPQPFHGRVYQVDTVYNNVDVIMPDRKRTLWADTATQVRVNRNRAQLIDIAMGDQVSGTYRKGPKGTLILVTIDDSSR
jgi:hypothetical protein